MNTTTSPASPPESHVRRRRRWPWVVGFCLAPFVILSLAALSYLSLDRDAAALRRSVMSATDAQWKTRVQASVGGLTLRGLRAGLTFVKHADAEKAQLALRAVTRASVGVYQRNSAEGQFALDKLLAETDRAMRERGWSRVIAVRDKPEVVLVYTPARPKEGQLLELCLAVIKAREIVVVATRLDADGLGDLVQQHLPEARYRKLQQLRTATNGAVSLMMR